MIYPGLAFHAFPSLCLTSAPSFLPSFPPAFLMLLVLWCHLWPPQLLVSDSTSLLVFFLLMLVRNAFWLSQRHFCSINQSEAGPKG